MLTPPRPDARDQEYQPNTIWPVMNMDLLWDPTLRWLTYPINPDYPNSPDDQNIWPLGTRGEQWIDVVANLGRAVESQITVCLPTDERSI
jgi:hypothetical protein